ncbi:MAG: hypothetical protein H0V53_14860 [Rubrobacter sp.]|nr:hypothetical protein [Rubrobacter sp.]
MPLAEFAGAKPAYGIKTGLNEAFLIDTGTKERLVREDPRSAEVIKPYLRGQDIKRWSPGWQDLWMIVLKSSENHDWPWSGRGEAKAEEVFRGTYPSLHAHMKPLEGKLRKRQDQGRYWWELRSCAYYEVFEQPKVIYQEIQTYPAFSYDTESYYGNNKVFILPTDDKYLLAVLNSPLMWWHNWRYLPHMINDTLTPLGVLMEKLPIAPPTDEARAAAEPAVERLIQVTKENAEAHRDLLYWLRVEFGVEKPGQKLADFAALGTDAFVEEARRRRPRDAGRLSPAALWELRDVHGESAGTVRERRAEAAGLERRLSELVNTSYGLTPEEIELLWATAPPRMPGF